MESLVFATGIALLALASAGAQETGKFTFDIEGGFTNTVGSAGGSLDSGSLDNGWNIRGEPGTIFPRGHARRSTSVTTRWESIQARYPRLAYPEVT